MLPEVVYRNAEGKVEGAHYDELTPILVAMAQQQRAAMDALKSKAAAQQTMLTSQAQLLTEVGALKQQYAEMQALKRAMQTELAEFRARDTRVALR